MKLDDGTTVYEKNYTQIMHGRSRIAEVRVNGSNGVFPGDITDDITYILEDQIGTSVLRLDTNGTKIDEEEYYPFGDSSLRTFTYKRYRYVGKERDAESGLYYYGARYYAAWTCRFISVDPLSKKYANLSPYNYADNNPINDYDIDGMQNNNSSGTPAGGGGNTSAAKGGGTNAGAGTNATNANKLPGFTPAQPNPNINSNSLRAAGTEGGSGATQMQNTAVKPVITSEPKIVGHQYPAGTFTSKAADPTARATSNQNTTGMAGDGSNPAPTDAQRLEQAAGMLSSYPEIGVGKGAFSANTSGEVSAGLQENDANLSGNPFTGEINKAGASGVMANSEGVDIGPYSLSNSVNTITETNIQHNAALTPTAIVETGFIIRDRCAQFGVGIARTDVTVIESKTLIPSGEVVPTRTVGSVNQKFVTFGFSYNKIQIQGKIPGN